MVTITHRRNALLLLRSHVDSHDRSNIDDSVSLMWILNDNW